MASCYLNKYITQNRPSRLRIIHQANTVLDSLFSEINKNLSFNQAHFQVFDFISHNLNIACVFDSISFIIYPL